jgi:hypothetical protein
MCRSTRTRTALAVTGTATLDRLPVPQRRSYVRALAANLVGAGVWGRLTLRPGYCGVPYGGCSMALVDPVDPGDPTDPADPPKPTCGAARCAASAISK